MPRRRPRRRATAIGVMVARDDSSWWLQALRRAGKKEAEVHLPSGERMYREVAADIETPQQAVADRNGGLRQRPGKLYCERCRRRPPVGMRTLERLADAARREGRADIYV